MLKNPQTFLDIDKPKSDSNMRFEVPDVSTPETDEKIVSETRKYNSQFVPDDFMSLSVYCRDNDGEVIGGLTGKTYWNYLDIEFLWVDESHRKSGIAAQVIAMAEDEARHRGCSVAMLDTYEFQALGFYLKQGYVQFGKLEEYCKKYERYYLKKHL